MAYTLGLGCSMATVEELEALDAATPPGPWVWEHWAGNGLCLVQKGRDHGGWVEIMDFVRKSVRQLGGSQARFWIPRPKDEPQGHVAEPVTAYQGGIWRDPGGFHLGKDMHPVAWWFQEGRQAFTEALKALRVVTEERDLWKARAIEKGWTE